MDNVYYKPEAFGLIPFGEFDLYEPDYSFDIVALWRDEDNNWYWASDSGCSCPTPFEDYHSVEELATGTLQDFQAWVEVIAYADNNRDYWYPRMVDLIARARIYENG